MAVYQNRLVVKIGTSTLLNELGNTDLYHIEKLVRVLADIHNRGYQVIVVSSGAIAIGTNKLNLGHRPTGMRFKQAAAAVGQGSLIALYDKFFHDYDKIIAQILLSEEDIQQDIKRQNLMNTFDSILELGGIPIVNANDSINSDEIESDDHIFGDNDRLSAAVAVLCQAKRLILLSDIDGLYPCDPKTHRDVQPIERIEKIDAEVYSYVATKGSRRGTGGVKTKLQAAEFATAHGCETSIINGKKPELLYEAIQGKSVGTLFAAQR